MAGDEDAIGRAVRGLDYERLTDEEFAVLQSAKRTLRSGEALSADDLAKLENIKGGHA